MWVEQLMLLLSGCLAYLEMKMSTKSTMKISVPSLNDRVKWISLEDSMRQTGWTPDVIFEIVQRYCDSQDHARNYRLKASAKSKLLKARLAQLALSAGMTVEEYLECEESNASSSASGE